jgi:hypothetical protein
MKKEEGMSKMVAYAMLGVLLVCMTPAVTGAQGCYNSVIQSEDNVVLLGQELRFEGADLSNVIKGSQDHKDIRWFALQTPAIDTTDFESRILPGRGIYYVDTNRNGVWGDNFDTKLYVQEPRLEIKLRDVDGNAIAATITGTNVTIDMVTNLDYDDCVDIRVTDFDGTEVSTNGVLLENVSVSGVRGFELDTKGLRTGEYLIWLETSGNGDHSQGLDISSNVVALRLFRNDWQLQQFLRNKGGETEKNAR